MYRLFIFSLFSCFFSLSEGRFSYGNFFREKPADSIQVSSGKLIVINEFKSKIIRSRTVLIWLPNEYLTQTNNRFPVTYMHDGQMLFDSSWTWNHQEWGMDELIAKSRYKSIVVGIFNDGNNRSGDYFPEKPWKSMTKESQDSIIRHRGGFESIFGNVGLNSDEYLRFLVEELKPYVDENYRTKKDPQHTVIGGASMGGLISWYALCEYPHVFGNAICLSTHWPGSEPLTYEAAPKAFEHYLKEKLPKDGQHRFFFARGTGYLDSFYTPFQKNVHRIFIDANYFATICGVNEINEIESTLNRVDYLQPMPCFQSVKTSPETKKKNPNNSTPTAGMSKVPHRHRSYYYKLYEGHDHKESAWQIQMNDAWNYIFSTLL